MLVYLSLGLRYRLLRIYMLSRHLYGPCDFISIECLSLHIESQYIHTGLYIFHNSVIRNYIFLHLCHSKFKKHHIYINNFKISSICSCDFAIHWSLRRFYFHYIIINWTESSDLQKFQKLPSSQCCHFPGYAISCHKWSTYIKSSNAMLICQHPHN
jgi:hypothetical protein